MRSELPRLADGRRVDAPVAAVWIGHAAAAVWKWLEAIGQRRGERALRDLGHRQLRAGVTSGPIRG